MKSPPIFKLIFEQPTPNQTRSKIISLATAYLDENGGAEKDARALSAGKALLSGVDVPKNLSVIHVWKLESFQHFNPSLLLDMNRHEEMVDAVRLAAEAKTPRAALRNSAPASVSSIPRPTRSTASIKS